MNQSSITINTVPGRAEAARQAPKRAFHVTIINCHGLAVISETTQECGRTPSYFNQSTGISGTIEYLKPFRLAHIENVVELFLAIGLSL